MTVSLYLPSYPEGIGDETDVFVVVVVFKILLRYSFLFLKNTSDGRIWQNHRQLTFGEGQSESVYVQSRYHSDTNDVHQPCNKQPAVIAGCNTFIPLVFYRQRQCVSAYSKHFYLQNFVYIYRHTKI